MNWMIDGAHGDLYRGAMGYPQLTTASDEWEIERNLSRKPDNLVNRIIKLGRCLLLNLAAANEAVRTANSSTEAAS